MIPATQVDAEMRQLASVFVERMLFAKSVGMTHGGLRDVWNVLGYDGTVTWQQYRERYDRGGIAARIVNAYPSAVWRGDGEVVENGDAEKQTEFEKAWWTLNDQHRVWSMLMRTHVLASVGSFAVILIGAQGDLSEPLPMGRPGQVLYLRPIGGGVIAGDTARRSNAPSTTIDAQVTVKDWDENTKSRRFGLPLTYNLKFSNFQTNTMKPVHWTRLVHVPSPGFIDDEVFGPPYLQDVWNYLIDIDKVAGGGAEAFWMRANAGLHIDVDKKTTLATDKKERDEELAAMREQAELYAHQMTRMIRTRGVNINQLGSDVADFSKPLDALVTLISGTKGIPKRILTGSEMGQLASEQDRDNWNDQVKDVRTNYAHPVVLRPFLQRLIDFGYMPRPAQWMPKWPEEGAMSDTEKLDAAGKMVKLNDNKTGEIIMLGSEVREFLGRPPLTDAQKAEIEDERAARMPDAEDGDEGEQVDRLEAALRRGGTLSLAINGGPDA